jgi:hypothetical protein
VLANFKLCRTVALLITLVGIYAETSPACVSIIGKDVKEPPPFLLESFAERSNNLECK